MKNNIVTLAAIGLMAGMVLMGCQKTGKTGNQNSTGSIGEAKPDSQATYSEMWQQFKSKSEQQIQDNENRIAAFKAKMEKSGTKMKAKYNKEIAGLEKANRGMQKKLEDYKNDGKSSWEQFKRGFNNEMDKLGKAVKELTSDNG